MAPLERQRLAGAAARAGVGVVERPQLGDAALAPRPLIERPGATAPPARRTAAAAPASVSARPRSAVDERGAGERLERDGEPERW